VHLAWSCNYRYAVENLADPMHAFTCIQTLHARVRCASGHGESRATAQGFIVRRVQQQGVNFDWVEIIAQPPILHARVVIPYPKAGGPAADDGHRFVTPIDERTCRIFFWRTRKVKASRASRGASFPHHLRGATLDVLEQDRRCSTRCTRRAQSASCSISTTSEWCACAATWPRRHAGRSSGRPGQRVSA